MRISNNLIALCLMVFLLLSGCMRPVTTHDTSEEPNISFRFVLPKPRPKLDEDQVFEIGSDGEWRLGGEQFQDGDVADEIDRLRLDGWKPIWIRVAEDAPFEKVANRFFQVGDNSLQLLTSQAHEKFRMQSAYESDEINSLRFQGQYNDFEFPVMVGYSESADRCFALIASDAEASPMGRSVRPSDFYDESFRKLDAIVRSGGGPEKLHADPDKYQSLVARIQSASGTPWRCVAGPLSFVRHSGWPSIQLEVVE